MAAINAAGYDADLASPSNHPLRDAIRQELAKRNIPSLPQIKAFFAEHRKRNDTEELSQYISFATPWTALPISISSPATSKSRRTPQPSRNSAP
jgi:hypothetical protein